jgi:hypothetical protein
MSVRRPSSRAHELVGEGMMQWAPDHQHIVANWDYTVENDEDRRVTTWASERAVIRVGRRAEGVPGENRGLPAAR